MMTVKDNVDKGDPGVVNPAFVVEDLGDVDVDKDDTASRSDGDGMSDTDSVSSLASTSSAPGISKFNLKMSPRPLRRSHRSLSQQHSPESYRSSYQSNRSSVCSTRKGILKKTASSTTINMEMANISQPQTPTDNGNSPRLSDSFEDNCSNGDISRFCRSTDDVPLHHQRSFNRVKFILDSGRPDNVTGDYDDIKMEKNDRSLGMDRGKIIEKDTSGLSKSGRRCLLFTAGLLVLTMAVILGSLFGSRKLSNIPVKSIITKVDDTFIRNAIEGRFKITNKQFTEHLHNFESEDFKKMSKDLEALISKVIYHEATPNRANSTVTLRIIKILKGSIVPIFRIKWEEKDELSDEEIRKRIMRHLDKFGSIGEYKVDKTSVSVSELQNNCHKTISGCSHTCVFSDQTLKFTCRCPDTLVLTNNTICTSPKQTTRKMPFIVPPVVNNIIKDSGAQFHSVNPETVPKKIQEEIVVQAVDNGTQLTNTTEKVNISTAISNGTSISSKAKIEKETKAKLEKSKVVKKEDVIDTKKVKGTDSQKETDSDLKRINDKDMKNKVKTESSKTSIKPKVDENKNFSVTVDTVKTVTEPSGKPKTPSKTQEKSKRKPLKKSDVTDTTTKSPTKNSNIESDMTLFTKSVNNKSTMTTENEISDDQSTTLNIKDTKLVKSSKEKDGINILKPSSKTSSISDNKPGDIDMKNTTVGKPKYKESSSKRPLEVKNDTNSVIVNTNDINQIENLLNKNNNNSNVKTTEFGKSDTNTSDEPQPTTKFKYIDKVDDKFGDSSQQKLKIKSFTKQPEKNNKIVTGLINTTNTHINNSVTERMSDMQVNFTNISNNESTIHYNVSGSIADTIFTLKNDSNKIGSNVNQIKGEPELSTNKTLLEILAPIPPKKESKNDTIISNTTNTDSTDNSPTTNDVVTVQAIPLAEIIIPQTERTPSPIVSDLLGNSSTKGVRNSTENSIGSDMSDKPINIGVIADISNILSSGNMSPSNDKTSAAKSEKDTMNSSTNKTKIDQATDAIISEDVSLCSEEEFQCVSGSSRYGACIPKSSRCDSVYDCFDKSDEKNCIANKCFGNYQCWSGDCIQREYVCDGIRHCHDGGDEEGCETWKCSDDEFKCDSTRGRVCISSSQRCDGQADCFDHSDERNCSTVCSSDQFLCPEGWCIPNLWKCDGTNDCDGGEDEHDCDCDGLDQSPCVVGGCVPTFKLCDGLRQCPDGSDEYGCLRIDNKTKQLEVRSEEKRWSPVCGDKWTNGWTELVCEQLGYGEAISTEVKKVNESVPRPRVKLSPEAPKVAQRGRAPLQYFLTPGKCATDPLVHVSCKQPTCGKWSGKNTNSASSDKSPAWPSLGLLIQPGSYEDTNAAFTHSCAATVITPVWVIASYSCLLSRPNGLEAEKWAFIIGESAPRVGRRNTQLRHAKQIVVHPGAKKKNSLWVGDAALLRLQSPLTLDDSTRLACLPDKPLGIHSNCKIATWTQKNKNNQEGIIQSVQRLPVPNLTIKTCNISYYNGKLDSSHVCASFMQNSHSPCRGKEGTPLMCRSSEGSWQIHGLLSLTSTCAKFELPSLFTDISSIKPWVMNTVEESDKSLFQLSHKEGNSEEGKPLARSLISGKIPSEVIKPDEKPIDKEKLEVKSS